MTLYFVQCVKEGRTVWRILAQNPMELGARLGKPCNKILRNLIVRVGLCLRICSPMPTYVASFTLLMLLNMSLCF